VSEPPVVDASPIILLARTELLFLLRTESDALLVPRAVAQELARKGRDDVAVRALRETPWLSVVSTGRPPREVRTCNLHRGEAAVLTWALAHVGTTAIVDERRARRCAEALGVAVRGTLGLVLRAKLQGTIPRARPLVERLVAAGLFLSASSMDAALALVGE
jgi:predicted nucleic acid-binding protein